MKRGRRPGGNRRTSPNREGREPRSPLAGRAVLFAGLRGAEVAERLEALGARVERRPTIAVEPPTDPEPARRILARLEDYDLLVFTSANGARSFAQLAGKRIPCLQPRVAAVGEATARALAEAGIAAAVVAPEARADALALALVRDGVAGLRVLVVGPERGTGTLPAELRRAGARVDEVAVYRTVASVEAAAVARDVAAGRYDAVVFTSPSSFEALLAAGVGGAAAGIVVALARVRRVAIGPTTAARLASAGLPADAVAASPGAEALAAAVVAAFAEA